MGLFPTFYTSWVTSHSTLTWWLCCLMFGSYFHISPSIHIFVSIGHCIILICLTWWLSRLRVVFTSLRFHYPCSRYTVCIHLFKFTEVFSTVFDFFLPETLLPQSSMSYDAIAMWCLISMTTTISVLILGSWWWWCWWRWWWWSKNCCRISGWSFPASHSGMLPGDV